ncbi:MAG: diadenylate cyclase CdaA [Proteobacteria bacterium]|nr:diadenylate cyclase CdaA [Pseudomonadota bacterium]
MLYLLTNFQWWSLLDILIIWLLIYHCAKLVRGTRAEQVLVGILVVSISYFLSNTLPLTTLRWLLSKFYASILIITIILFQDEIKSALSKLGKNPLLNQSDSSAGSIASTQYAFDEIVRATSILAQQKIGALIILEKNIILDRYVEVGVKIDAAVSHQILVSIFHPTSPIHDGAVIIKQGRVAVAGCFLPLSQSSKLALHMGTRHRAGFGISEQTDAVVILVSEERGSIHLIYDGHIESNLTAPGLMQRLIAHASSNLQQKQVSGLYGKYAPMSSSRVVKALRRHKKSNKD